MEKETEKQKFKSTMDYLILKRVDLNSKDKDGIRFNFFSYF